MLAKGKKYEQLAHNFLQQQGLQTLALNYSCHFGEIDLIMQDKEEIVFVEVRMRNSSYCGGAFASVTRQKQKKICLTAEHFLQKKNIAERQSCRFDVIAFQQTQHSELHPIHPIWLRQAFSAESL